MYSSKFSTPREKNNATCMSDLGQWISLWFDKQPRYRDPNGQDSKKISVRWITSSLYR